MADKSVCINLSLRDGSKKEISSSVQVGSGDASYLTRLSDVLKTVQTQTNSFLTEIVEKERGVTQVSQKSNVKDGCDIDDEEDSDEEDNSDHDKSDTGEPPLKQPKI